MVSANAVTKETTQKVANQMELSIEHLLFQARILNIGGADMGSDLIVYNNCLVTEEDERKENQSMLLFTGIQK